MVSGTTTTGRVAATREPAGGRGNDDTRVGLGVPARRPSDIRALRVTTYMPPAPMTSVDRTTIAATTGLTCNRRSSVIASLPEHGTEPFVLQMLRVTSPYMPVRIRGTASAPKPPRRSWCDPVRSSVERWTDSGGPAFARLPRISVQPRELVDPLPAQSQSPCPPTGRPPP